MKYPLRMKPTLFGILCLLIQFAITPAYGWGDEGHEVVALIADHYLEPAVRLKVSAILAGDTTRLTPNTHIDQHDTIEIRQIFGPEDFTK